MAGGAVVQIISIGLQDRALTASPELTYWKGSYKQYAIFAVESIENLFQTQCDFGKKAVAVVGRAGDLLGVSVFQATLPQIAQELAGSTNGTVYARWQDFIGEQLIQECSIDVGGNPVSRFYGDYMHIWNQLSLPEGKLEAYYKMIGHTTQLTYLTDPSFADINQPCQAAGVPGQVCVPRQALPETTLYIKLLFWFCENPAMAIPILALQFHEVRINLSVKPLLECLWAVNSLDISGSTSNRQVRAAYAQSLVSASLYLDYTFCEIDERKFFVSNPHEYLYDQVQCTGDVTVGTALARIPLALSHPNQEIIFVAQPAVNVDICASFESGEPLFNQLGIQPFNYTDALDALPNSIRAFGSPDALSGSQAFMANYSVNGINQWGFQQAGGASMPGASTNSQYTLGTNATNGVVYSTDSVTGAYNVVGGSTAGSTPSTFQAPFANHSFTSTTSGSPAVTTIAESYPSIVGLSDPAIFVLAESAFHMHCWGENPVITARLTFNNTDRFSDREGSYFDVFQGFQYHTRAADTGINVYSFAISPESLQPSGTLNFSRTESPVIVITLSSAVIYGNSAAIFRLYGRGKNIFRVVGGMGGTTFAGGA